MPTRSNIFQRLVTEIHRELGTGWIVQESRELTDSVTGYPREVDIVAESAVGGYPLLLCIEVRDRARPADVTWLESMAKKHDHLPTNKLVVWSSSGFTHSCLVKAKALGIAAVVPDSLDAARWTIAALQLVGSVIKFVQPKLSPLADVMLENGELVRWECQPATLLVEEYTFQQMPIGALLDQMIRSVEFQTACLDHAPEGFGPGGFYAVYDPPFPCTLEGPEGTVGRLTRLIIDVETACEVTPIISRSALHNGTLTTIAEATALDKKYKYVLRQNLTAFNEIRTIRTNLTPEKPV